MISAAAQDFRFKKTACLAGSKCLPSPGGTPHCWNRHATGRPKSAARSAALRAIPNRFYRWPKFRHPTPGFLDGNQTHARNCPGTRSRDGVTRANHPRFAPACRARGIFGVRCSTGLIRSAGQSGRLFLRTQRSSQGKVFPGGLGFGDLPAAFVMRFFEVATTQP